MRCGPKHACCYENIWALLGLTFGVHSRQFGLNLVCKRREGDALPVVVVHLFAQRSFIKGIFAGSLVE
jgi:hypothetical protein